MPLPDVPQADYDAYTADQFTERTSQRILGLGGTSSFLQSSGRRIAGLGMQPVEVASASSPILQMPMPPPVWQPPAPPTLPPLPIPAPAPPQIPTPAPGPSPVPPGAPPIPMPRPVPPISQPGGIVAAPPSAGVPEVRLATPQRPAGEVLPELPVTPGPAVSGPSTQPRPVWATPSQPRAPLFADQQPAVGAQGVDTSAPAMAAVNAAPPGELQNYARQAARNAGIDPSLFLAQIQQESGFNPRAGSAAGAQGIAQIVPQYHPGVDPSDPYASLDYAAQMMRRLLSQYQGDWQKALVAYNGGGGAVAAWDAGQPYAESQTYVSRILGRGRPSQQDGGRAGARPAGTAMAQSQFGDAQLTASEAYAACGPAAAVRFAQAYGRNPTLKEALELARSVGWTAESGMAGITSEQRLMAKLGIPTRLLAGRNWEQYAQEAQSGNPITISTPGHYFYADGYNPQSGAFHVGRSGLDLRSGKEWMTAAEMEGLMGQAQGALLANNPTINTSSATVAGQPASLDDTRRQISASFGAPTKPAQPAQLPLAAQPADPQVRRLDRAVEMAYIPERPRRPAVDEGTTAIPPLPSVMAAGAPPPPPPGGGPFDQLGQMIADAFKNVFGGGGGPPGGDRGRQQRDQDQQQTTAAREIERFRHLGGNPDWPELPLPELGFPDFTPPRDPLEAIQRASTEALRRGLPSPGPGGQLGILDPKLGNPFENPEGVLGGGSRGGRTLRPWEEEVAAAAGRTGGETAGAARGAALRANVPERWPTFEQEAWRTPKTWYGDPQLSQREIEQIAQGAGFREVTPGEFADAITSTAAKADPENPGKLIGDSLSTYSPEEYSRMRTFLAKDGGWGYALNPTPAGQEIVSVFRDPTAPRGAGIAATAHGVVNGATRLDAFDINDRLPRLYSRFGFTEVERNAWDSQYGKGLFRDPATGKWTAPEVTIMERRTPAAQAAAEAQQQRILRLTAREVAEGRPPHPGAHVLEEEHAIPGRRKGVVIPKFMTRSGEAVPLRSPATAGDMGEPQAQAYIRAIGGQGGRKALPVGRFTRSDGTRVPFDSPAEAVFMSDLEEAKQSGRIKDWWRSEDSPIAELKDVQYINTHPDKFGYGTYKGDFVIQHTDNSLELREVKDAKVLKASEEYGGPAGAETGKLGWHVLKKAIGIIPDLAKAGTRYNIVDSSEAGKLLRTAPSDVAYRTPLPARLPSGELAGRTARTVAGMPGIDWRDVPEMMSHLPGGSGQLPVHQVVNLVNETSKQAVEMASQGATRQEITRYVRDRLLPTADIVGRTYGPTRMVSGATISVGDMLGKASAMSRQRITEAWPEAAQVLDSAAQRGVKVDQLMVGAGDRAGIVLKASGDPAGIEATAAELGSLSQSTRATVMYPDTSPVATGGRFAQPVIVPLPSPEAERALDAVAQSLSDQAVIGYNPDGSAVLHVVGESAEDARRLGLHVQSTLAEDGIEATLDNQARVAVSDLAGEGYARAIARRRELLGETPFGGAYPSSDRGGVGAGAGQPSFPAHFDEGVVAETRRGADLRQPSAGGADRTGPGTGRPGLLDADQGEAGRAAGALPAQPEVPSAAGDISAAARDALADPEVGPAVSDLLRGESGQATPAFALHAGGAASGGLLANAYTDPDDPNRAAKISAGAAAGYLGGRILGRVLVRGEAAAGSKLSRSAPQKAYDAFVRRYSDSLVDLNHVQEDFQRRTGEHFTDEMAMAYLARVDPSNRALIASQNAIGQAVQKVERSGNFEALSKLVSLESDIATAEGLGTRAEEEFLRGGPAPSVEARMRTAESAVKEAQALVDRMVDAQQSGKSLGVYGRPTDQQITSARRGVASATRELAAAQADRVQAHADMPAAAAAQGQAQREGRTFEGGRRHPDLVREREQLLADWGAKPDQFADIRKAADDIFDYRRVLLEEMIDSRLITRADADNLIRVYPKWTPSRMTEYMYEQGPGGMARGSRVNVNGPGFRSYTDEGSAGPRENRIASLMRESYDVYARGAQNRTFNAFVDYAEQTKPEGIKRIAANMDEYQSAGGASGDLLHPNYNVKPGKGEVKITGMRDGVKQEWITDNPYLQAAVEMAPDSPMSGVVGKLYQSSAHLVTTTATARNPKWLAKNVMRDAATYLVGTMAEGGVRGNLLPLASTYGPAMAAYLGTDPNDPNRLQKALAAGAAGYMARSAPGIRRAFGPNLLGEMIAGYADGMSGITSGTFTGKGTQEFLMRGGGMRGGTISRHGVEGGERLLKEIRDPGGIGVHNASDLGGLLKDAATFGWVKALGQRLELGPRVAAMRVAEQRGATRLGSMIAGRDVTLDFDRGGLWTKQVNRFIPFMNAQAQGGARFTRLMRDHPEGMLLAGATLVGGPTLAAMQWNRADPQRSADYDNVPDYIKARGPVLMLPWVGTDKDGNRQPLHVDFDMSQFAPFSTLGQEVYDRAQGQPGRSPGDLTKAVLGSVVPGGSSNPVEAATQILPVPASTVAQLGLNRDIYRGTTIANQFSDERATAIAKAVAPPLEAAITRIPGLETYRVRPSQLDFLVRDILGGAGQTVTETGNVLSGQPPRVPGAPSEAPVVGGLASGLLRTTGGQNFEDARQPTNMLRQDVREKLRALGDYYEPSVVPDQIEKIPLRQDEQAEYQRMTNEIFNERMARLSELSTFKNERLRKAAIEQAMTQARDLAALRVKNQIRASGSNMLKRRIEDSSAY